MPGWTLRPTQRDVARLANVSQTVVSAVMRGDRTFVRFSPEAAEAVRRAAAQLNYRANAVARSMRSRRFRNIGLLLSHPGEVPYVPGQIYTGVLSSVARRGYFLSFVHDPSDRVFGKDTVPLNVVESQVDGFIVLNTGFISAELLTELERGHVPYVLLNSERSWNCVGIDDRAAGELAARHVLAAGYRHPIFVQDIGGMRPDNMRLAGYAAAVREAGCREATVYASYDAMEAEINARLRAEPEIDALVCANDLIACQALRALLALGRHAGRDCGVVGFNGELIAELAPSPLTTVVMPWQEMAEKAVERICELIDSPTLKKERDSFPGVLRALNSTRRTA